LEGLGEGSGRVINICNSNIWKWRMMQSDRQWVPFQGFNIPFDHYATKGTTNISPQNATIETETN
ncbi:hypothetical protein LOAG_12819, partial [Loa loa]